MSIKDHCEDIDMIIEAMRVGGECDKAEDSFDADAVEYRIARIRERAVKNG